jgi:geranylgeranyl diphosphate synthase type I
VSVNVATRQLAPDTVRQDVLAVVADLLDDCEGTWATDGAGAVHVRSHGRELLDELRRWFATEGKMLRARFCQLGHAAAGASPDRHVVRLGAALELLHTFAIVQDDVMDASGVRRGVPTTHVRFEHLHAESGWRGERRRFAEASAVLVGDLAHALANRLVGDLPATVRTLWASLCQELVLGQYLDVRGTAAGADQIGYAESVALLKSARYTVSRPLQLGAALTGAGPQLVEALGRFGESLGLAFQLRDDLLGVFGDSSLTGKPVGDDLRDGKPTVLLALTTRRAPVDALPLLAKIGTPTLTEEEVGAITQLCISTGAMREVSSRIDREVAEAHRVLQTASLAPEVSDSLAQLADDMTWRHR